MVCFWLGPVFRESAREKYVEVVRCGGDRQGEGGCAARKSCTFCVAGGMCLEKVQVKCGGGVLQVLRACLHQR